MSSPVAFLCPVADLEVSGVCRCLLRVVPRIARTHLWRGHARLSHRRTGLDWYAFITDMFVIAANLLVIDVKEIIIPFDLRIHLILLALFLLVLLTRLLFRLGRGILPNELDLSLGLPNEQLRLSR